MAPDRETHTVQASGEKIDFPRGSDEIRLVH
jgi:hypothetical protein